MDPSPPWKALGEAVKSRRHLLRLTQDLTGRGGPGHVTIRKIESGETTSLRAKTKTQLETALAWRSGMVDEILNGVTAPESSKGCLSQPDRDVTPRWAVEMGERLDRIESLLQRQALPSEEVVRRLRALRVPDEMIERDVYRRAGYSREEC